MTYDIITYVFSFLIIFTMLIYFWQERKRIYLYSFFELRDRLYRSVVDKKVNDNSLAYLNLSLMVNTVLAFPNYFNLTIFIKTLEQNEIEKAPSDFIEDIKKQSQDFQNISSDFFYHFIKLILVNHPIIFLLIRIRESLSFLKKILRTSNQNNKKLYSAYNSYRSAYNEVKSDSRDTSFLDGILVGH